MLPFVSVLFCVGFECQKESHIVGWGRGNVYVHTYVYAYIAYMYLCVCICMDMHVYINKTVCFDLE